MISVWYFGLEIILAEILLSIYGEPNFSQHVRLWKTAPGERASRIIFQFVPTQGADAVLIIVLFIVVKPRLSVDSVLMRCLSGTCV